MSATPPTPTAEPLLVACLCAQWCRTCDAYRDTLVATRDDDAPSAIPRAALRFVWVDIEDESELVGDLDIEDFPTLLLARGDQVLFFGPVLPHAQTLDRLVRSALDTDLPPLSRRRARARRARPARAPARARRRSERSRGQATRSRALRLVAALDVGLDLGREFAQLGLEPAPQPAAHQAPDDGRSGWVSVSSISVPACAAVVAAPEARDDRAAPVRAGHALVEHAAVGAVVAFVEVAHRAPARARDALEARPRGPGRELAQALARVHARDLAMVQVGVVGADDIRAGGHPLVVLDLDETGHALPLRRPCRGPTGRGRIKGITREAGRPDSASRQIRTPARREHRAPAGPASRTRAPRRSGRWCRPARTGARRSACTWRASRR